MRIYVKSGKPWNRLSDEDCAYYLFEGVLAVGDLLARDLTGKGQFMFNSKLQSKIANGDTDLLNRVIDSLKQNADFFQKAITKHFQVGKNYINLKWRNPRIKWFLYSIYVEEIPNVAHVEVINLLLIFRSSSSYSF